MNLFMKIAVLFLFSVLSACTAVFTPEPIGDTVVELDVAQWQGTWLHPDMVVITTVLDSDKGKLPGEITDDGVVLGKLTAAQLEMITTTESNLMEWDNPGVLIRIAD